MAVDLVVTYPGRVDAADAEYPFGKPRNQVSPGDGTPFDEALYRDYVGMMAAVMRQAGITAVTNVPEKVGASEMLQGIARHVSGSVFYEDSGVADAYVIDVPGTLPNVFESPSVLFDGMLVRWVAANANVGASTLDVEYQGVSISSPQSLTLEGGGALTGGEIDTITENEARFNLGSARFELTKAGGLGPASTALATNVITGLGMANGADTDHDIDIAVGSCFDSLTTDIMDLTSAITKQIDAAWVVGTNLGGLFSGSVAIDTWYHVFLIKKDSDGSIDAGFDTSVTAANIPAGYTAFRRIGSVLTDGSSNIIPFFQHGNWFDWLTSKNDVSTGVTAGARTLFALSTPVDVRCQAVFSGFFVQAPSSASMFFTSPDVTDEAALSTAARGHIFNIVGVIETSHGHGNIFIWTNTSSQIGVNVDITVTTLDIGTTGYQDLRGQE